MEEIQAKVIQIISEQLGKDESEIKMSSHFIEDLSGVCKLNYNHIWIS